MKYTLLVLLIAVGASANTFTTFTLADGFVDHPNNSCTSSGPVSSGCSSGNFQGSSASALAGLDSVTGLPFLDVSLSSICRVGFGCTVASGSAAFSVDFTISGAPDGDLGIAQFETLGDAVDIYGRTTFAVNLPITPLGYEFVFGQPFTVTGSVNGGCSECAGSGFMEMQSSIPIYDLSGELLDTVHATGPQIIAAVPEPGTRMLAGLGLLAVLTKLTFRGALQKKRL